MLERADGYNRPLEPPEPTLMNAVAFWGSLRARDPQERHFLLTDGKRIAFLRIGSDGTQHIEAVTTGGEAAALPGVRFSDGNGPFDFSPDGKLTVYTVGETLSSEIWLMDLHSEKRSPRRSLLTRLLH